MLEMSIHGDEDGKAGSCGRGDQLTVLQIRPAALVGDFNLMPEQRLAQWNWRALIEQNPRSRHRQGASRGVLQYFTRPLQRNPRKPFDELMNRGIVFKVFEQRRNRHTRATKHSGTAHASRGSFHSQAA